MHQKARIGRGGEGGGGVANNVRSSESTQNADYFDVSPITMVFFVEEIRAVEFYPYL